MRLRRCISGSLPRCGRAASGAIKLGFEERGDAVVASAASGRGAPGGGIDCVRSLRTTFSHWSASALTLVSAAGSMTKPPLFSRSL